MKRFTMKRITALVLALVMTLSLLPTTVWAEEEQEAEYDPFAGLSQDAQDFADQYLVYNIFEGEENGQTFKVGQVLIKNADLYWEGETCYYTDAAAKEAATAFFTAYKDTDVLPQADRKNLDAVRVGDLTAAEGPTVGYAMEVYYAALSRNTKNYVYSIADFESINTEAYTWLSTYGDYGSYGEGVIFVKNATLKNSYPADESSYDNITAACVAYEALSSEAKEALTRLYVTDWAVETMISEISGFVQLPYYSLLTGLTDKDTIEFIETYVVCRAYESWYMTQLAGVWQWNGTEDVYNPTAAKAALDAYDALSDAAKKALESQLVKQGDPTNSNDYWTPSFAVWMQRQQADYLFQTNPDAGTLIDPTAMTNPDAKDFFEDYFEYDTYTDDYFGCDVLNFWMNVPTAPDGGYLTQEGYDKAAKMLAEYNALSEAAKKELDKLRVDGSRNSSFGWQLMQRYGDLRMAAPTGTATKDSLSQKALDFLGTAGLTLTDDGELSITDVKMVYVDGEYQYWIDYSKTDKDEGLANMNKVSQVLAEWFGLNFDNTLDFPPIHQRDWELVNELNQLKITVNGEEMWFEKAMEYFLETWNRMESRGYYQDYLFQVAGYTALPLGTEENTNKDTGFEKGFFYVDVVDGLVEGVDYTYEYTYNGTTYIFDDAGETDPKTKANDDPSMQGILTIRVKAGEKDHWKEAFENTPKVSRNAGVLFSVRIVGPDGSAQFAEVCGNGISSVFTKYLYHNTEPYTTELYESANFGSESGNGRPLASINQVGEVVTINPSDHYAIDHMLTVWYGAGEVAIGRNMLRFRVIVEDDFSYEFNVPVEYAEATDVTFVDTSAWEITKNVPGELIVRPKNGTIKNTLNVDLSKPFNSEDYVFGSFTLTPPEDGYTLDIVESNNLTQDGKVWIKEGPDTTSTVTLNLYANDCDGGRAHVTFYTFVWKNENTDDVIEETLTVRVTERQSYFADMANGTVSAQPVSKEDVDDAQSLLGVAKTYDEALGFLDVTFDEENLPSVEVAKALHNRAGVEITPPEGATHFRTTMGDGNRDLAYVDTKEAVELVAGLREANIRAIYRDSGSMTPDAQNELTFPYAAVDPMVLGDLTIYFAYTQNYRWQAYEWLKEDGNGGYTTVGYTYIYGKNSSLVQTETTVSVSDEKDLPVNEDGELEQPIIIGEDMKFTCNRYIQEGSDGKQWYFRLMVDDETKMSEDGNWVYLPYCYFGDLTWEKAQKRVDKPVIYHYHQGENMEPERLEGEYTEHGVRFKAKSFSPYVIELSATEVSTEGDTGGNTGSYPGGYYPVVTPDKDTTTEDKTTETKPVVTPTTTPSVEETVTPEVEDTTPAVIPEDTPVDDPVVDEAPADDVEPSSGNAGLWIGIGIVALAAIVVVLAIMAARKKRK